MDNHTRGLRYIKLDLSQLKLLVFVDALFANNKDLSSQIEYVITVANEHNKDANTINITGNILH
jgi:hypothetical protein